jgi:hypothetical protein
VDSLIRPAGPDASAASPETAAEIRARGTLTDPLAAVARISLDTLSDSHASYHPIQERSPPSAGRLNRRACLRIEQGNPFPRAQEGGTLANGMLMAR